MRADPRACAALGLAVVGGACLASRPAAAEAVPVQIELQYQHADHGPSLWSNNMSVGYAHRLSPALQLSGQFRLDALNYVNRPERSLIPYGALQVAHSFAGFTASYRPSRTVNQASITTRQNEAQVSAFVAPPHLPRLDVQWISRAQRTGEVLSPGTGITRSGHLSWNLGAFELRGGAGDIRVDPDATNARQIFEQNWDTGFGVRTVQGGWNLHADAGVGEVRRGVGDELPDRNRTEQAMFEASRRLSRHMDLGVNYQYRGVELSSGLPRRYGSHDGAATWSLRPTVATQVLVVGGVRPVSQPSGKNVTLAFMNAAGTAEGRVRTGWTAMGSVSQTFNGNRGGQFFRIGTYRVGSRFLLARGLRLDLGGTLTASGDPAVRDQRMTVVNDIGMTANPPHFLLSWGVRSYRSGRGLTRPSAHSLTRNLEMRWQPSPAVDLGASLAKSGQLPTGDPTLTTERFTAQLSPTGKLQLHGEYNRSNRTRQDTGVGRLTGREVWTGRLLAGLGRRYRVSVGGSVADPGTALHERQVDASLSMRLGGPS